MRICIPPRVEKRHETQRQAQRRERSSSEGPTARSTMLARGREHAENLSFWFRSLVVLVLGFNLVVRSILAYKIISQLLAVLSA